MSDHEIRRLGEADPLGGLGTELESVTDHQEDLIRGILATADPEVAPARPSRVRGRLFRAGFALAAVGAIVFAVILTGTGSKEESGNAWASELIEFAEASPLVLIDLPDWQVTYVNEQGKNHGDMYLVNPRKNIAVELKWNGSPPDRRQRDLSNYMRRVASDYPVLDTTTDVYAYGENKNGMELTSAWGFNGQTLKVRTGVPDLKTYREILAGFVKVDVDTWLSALPESVIKSADRSDAIQTMLEGVPLPDGFDPASIRGTDLTKDEYQLGGNVAGTVACTWFRQWSEARRDGDQETVDEAIDAMSTSKTWPVLRRMTKSGAYPEVVWSYAEAMRSGRYYGRPLERDVNQGLGCEQLGIRLEVPTNEHGGK